MFSLFTVFIPSFEVMTQRALKNENSNHHEKIEELIHKHPVFIFMKGTPDQPMCRFSALVMDIFENLRVNVESYNVLEDPLMREAIKDYTDWPTLPQIFIDGNFIGGADILQELNDNGELKKMLPGNSNE